MFIYAFINLRLCLFKVNNNYHLMVNNKTKQTYTPRRITKTNKQNQHTLNELREYSKILDCDKFLYIYIR